MDAEKYEKGVAAGEAIFETAAELEGVTDPEELADWYERELYALGTMAGTDESFDAGYFVGMRRTAGERGLLEV